MKKVFSVFLLLFSFLFLISGIVQADLVPCGQPGGARCELGDIFTLILNVYNYVLVVGFSLAGLAVVIGGVVLILSAGNPNLASTAKRILWGAIVGIVLISGAWLIIHTVLWTIGYSGPI